MNTFNEFPKKKLNNKTWIVIGIVSVLSLGSVGTYFALNQPTNHSSEKTSKSSSKENTSDNQKVKLTSDGMKKIAPADELIWRQFYNNDGIPMISGLGKKDESENSAASNDKQQIDENLFISAASNFVSQAKLNAALFFLGKTKEELEADNKLDPSSFDVAYDKDGIADKISININPSTPEQIIHYAGKPVSSLDNLAFLYHGHRFDFIIHHTTGGTLFNKMTIRPVPNQNTADQQPQDPEQPQQQQQVQAQQQEPLQPIEKPKQNQPKPGQQTQQPKDPVKPQPDPEQPKDPVEPQPEPEQPKDPVEPQPEPEQPKDPVEPQPEPEQPNPDKTQRGNSSAS